MFSANDEQLLAPHCRKFRMQPYVTCFLLMRLRWNWYRLFCPPMIVYAPVLLLPQLSTQKGVLCATAPCVLPGLPGVPPASHFAFLRCADRVSLEGSCRMSSRDVCTSLNMGALLRPSTSHCRYSSAESALSK